MSVDSSNQWMVAISTKKLIESIAANTVHVASFYGHMQGRRMNRELYLQLLDALKLNCTLQVLDLDHNEIGRWEDGVEKLLEAVDHIDTLRKLNLNSSQVGDADVAVICKFLESNTTIEDLWLYGNNISFKGAMLLHQTILSSNTTLKVVNLRNNGLSLHNQDLLINNALSTARPRSLTLRELCRLHVFAKRIPYKKGVFPEPSMAWDDILFGKEEAPVQEENREVDEA
eukprot:TRINITY_DN10548_c0_g1_i1.p1 TRINITY_DN10548_c0_g1~~TRINITY_DN10548_c0_g1_i1.p1  ORF type:complete len:229 (+),score=29.60 TRINITY_DN10548_c0_g1_i1:196-882(+)